MNDFLTPTSQLGAQTRIEAVRSPNADAQPWLKGSLTCAALDEHHIIHLGTAKAYPPFRFVRVNRAVTHFLTCFGGTGYMMIDGQWMACGMDRAALFPPHSAIAYYAGEGEPWKLAWVCYRFPGGDPGFTSVSSPVFAGYDAAPIYSAIQTLYAECQATNDPECTSHFVSAIHRLANRFAKPYQDDDRMHEMWELVACNLQGDWTNEALAGQAGCPEEQLRRLCQRKLGRSPMQQVTHLRIQRGAELLTTTGRSLWEVAEEVGYADVDAFSSVFKKWVGCSPLEYRQIPASGI